MDSYFKKISTYTFLILLQTAVAQSVMARGFADALVQKHFLRDMKVGEEMVLMAALTVSWPIVIGAEKFSDRLYAEKILRELREGSNKTSFGVISSEQIAKMVAKYEQELVWRLRLNFGVEAVTYKYRESIEDKAFFSRHLDFGKIAFATNAMVEALTTEDDIIITYRYKTFNWLMYWRHIPNNDYFKSKEQPEMLRMRSELQQKVKGLENLTDGEFAMSIVAFKAIFDSAKKEAIEKNKTTHNPTSAAQLEPSGP